MKRNQGETVAIVEKYQLSPQLEISRAVTGLWQIADMEKDGQTLDPAKTSESMAPYVERGLSTFDMADHYGSAEVISGHFHCYHPRGKSVVLLTKWVPKPGAVSKEKVRRAVLERCERLQTDRVDLLQFHAWTFSNPFWLDALLGLQELKEEGLIGDLGTTNFDTAHLQVARKSGIDIVSNQVSYSLVDQRASGEMADFCAKEGISILAYGTLCGGFISQRWLQKPEPTVDSLPNWSLMKYKRFIDIAGGWSVFQDVLREVSGVAQEVGQSISTVASKYILDQKSVAAVIIGARLGQSSHIDETISLFDFSLSDVQRNRIQGALSYFSPIAGDCGDEYRKPPYLTASGDLSHHVDDFPKAFVPIGESDVKKRVDSGTIWEKLAGYSRAVRIGDRVLVSGTTSTHGVLLIGGNDPIAQTHFIIDKIEASLESVGAKLSDVVRTRIYVSSTSHWEDVARVHGARFAGIMPANTMVETKLIGEEYLVEIEAEAVIQ
jgi:aryl-alcohol dehydrogenase-like predicted oxidoreductase/enamine deaminase RidA (YjgF/YER057c/UK114 family)